MDTIIYLNVSSIKNPSYVSNFDVKLDFVSQALTAFTPVVGTISIFQPDKLS